MKQNVTRWNFARACVSAHECDSWQVKIYFYSERKQENDENVERWKLQAIIVKEPVHTLRLLTG